MERKKKKGEPLQAEMQRRKMFDSIAQRDTYGVKKKQKKKANPLNTEEGKPNL